MRHPTIDGCFGVVKYPRALRIGHGNAERAQRDGIAVEGKWLVEWDRADGSGGNTEDVLDQAEMEALAEPIFPETPYVSAFVLALQEVSGGWEGGWVGGWEVHLLLLCLLLDVVVGGHVPILADVRIGLNKSGAY